jgi:hypothetical protein
MVSADWPERGARQSRRYPIGPERSQALEGPCVPPSLNRQPQQRPLSIDLIPSGFPLSWLAHALQHPAALLEARAEGTSLSIHLCGQNSRILGLRVASATVIG